MSRLPLIAVLILVLPGAAMLYAQAYSQPRLDLGVTYTAQRSLRVNSGQNFWMQGGSAELGADVWRGWGIAADVTGSHASSIGSSGIPLSLITVTFGPRYRWHAGHRMSLYAEGLIGEADGFRSVFPGPGTTQASTTSFAAQAGGGVDYRLSRRFAVRLIDAGWVRTQSPNSTGDVQNNLRLGAGLVVRFGH